MAETRLMAKAFVCEDREKGAPLQTKINSFTKDKAIVAVHDFNVVRGRGQVKEDGPETDIIRASLLYEALTADDASAPRVYGKVIPKVPLTSEFQTKVNSWSKDKDITVHGAVVVTQPDGTTADVVLLYNDHNKTGGEEPEAPGAEDAAPAEAPAEPAAAAAEGS